MDIDSFIDLVRFRRSIRGFDRNRDVPQEVIEKILEAARWAPSGGNGQPWEFVVIRDREMRHRVADLYVRQLEQKKEMERAVRGFARMPGPGFRDAPVFILVVGDPRVNRSYPVRTILEKGEQHFISGLANATYSLHLAAASLGLASQYMSDASSPYMSTMLKVWLGIPDPLRVYELIPIGYPVRRPEPTPRRPLAEIVHWERYDPARRRSDDDVEAFLLTQTRLGAYGRQHSGDAAPEDVPYREP